VKIGCAVTIRNGMMEYWSVGIMGITDWDLILSGSHGPEYKFNPSSVFDSQFSIILSDP